jgi:hypothetical protein
MDPVLDELVRRARTVMEHDMHLFFVSLSACGFGLAGEMASAALCFQSQLDEKERPLEPPSGAVAALVLWVTTPEQSQGLATSLQSLQLSPARDGNPVQIYLACLEALCAAAERVAGSSGTPAAEMVVLDGEVGLGPDRTAWLQWMATVVAQLPAQGWALLVPAGSTFPGGVAAWQPAPHLDRRLRSGRTVLLAFAEVMPGRSADEVDACLLARPSLHPYKAKVLAAGTVRADVFLGTAAALRAAVASLLALNERLKNRGPPCTPAALLSGAALAYRLATAVDLVLLLPGAPHLHDARATERYAPWHQGFDLWRARVQGTVGTSWRDAAAEPWVRLPPLQPGL